MNTGDILIFAVVCFSALVSLATLVFNVLTYRR